MTFPSFSFIINSIEFIQPLMTQTKTQRLINRINEKESFYDVAYVCEDFETFEIEVAEWGVDFDDPEVCVPMMDAYFASFGCTPSNPHPCSKYALGV